MLGEGNVLAVGVFVWKPEFVLLLALSNTT